MPGARAAEFRRAATRLGFLKVRQTGSHERWLHPDGRAVTIPVHGGREIGPPLYSKILAQLGIGETPLFSQAASLSFVHQQEIRPGFERKGNSLSLAPIQQRGQFRVRFARSLDGEPIRFRRQPPANRLRSGWMRQFGLDALRNDDRTCGIPSSVSTTLLHA